MFDGTQRDRLGNHDVRSTGGRPEARRPYDGKLQSLLDPVDTNMQIGLGFVLLDCNEGGNFRGNASVCDRACPIATYLLDQYRDAPRVENPMAVGSCRSSVMVSTKFSWRETNRVSLIHAG
jgi:hypothetical protein